ncbi:Uncharacterised protein [Citrobacter koseri]|uniref:Uncharacterized protein n=1 Tax=Citrobacter koseri TaxID=545 RepID=A0A2X2X649_CITKO|nr:Uncharacterised protein [Citrobacter koseri]
MADLATVWPTRKASVEGGSTFTQPLTERQWVDKPVSTEDRRRGAGTF